MILKKIFSFASVTLLVAFTLSSVAAWYSILGLTAIFSAAVIPIMIMGVTLEIAKVVTTVWLHRYWDRAGWKLKLYLVPAVMALAFLTSMGIFGFLSKAHSDQTLVSGDVGAKVELIDEKIKIARDNIAMNQKALEQMNAQVDQLLGRTTDDTGANRAVQVRRQQAAERTRLNNEIAAEQETIAKLNEEAAPVRAQIRKVEAEVGPIKYIAALLYGDNPDSNLLERAVRWVIILIVFVFDPLALVLVLAAQSSYKWLDDDLRNCRPEEQDQFKEAFLNDKIDKEGSKQLDKILSDTSYDVKETKTLASTVLSHEPESNADTHTEVPETLNAIDAPGITYEETDGGYVQYHGKSVSKTALLGMHPELFSAKVDTTPTSTNFGAEFPKFAKRGDVFVRVDMLPNKVYKFDGAKWIETNKNHIDSYLYDEEYIRHLVTKIESGEYDVGLLSENEKVQIEEYLKKQ